MKFSKFLWPTILGAAIVATYAVFMSRSSFMQDDYGQISLARLSFSEQINEWVGLWGSRPVSLYALTTLIQIVKSNWAVYVCINCALFFYTLWAFYVWHKPFSRKFTVWLALGLAAFPSMSSTVIFSPVNQFTATLSLALAASGHIFYTKSIETSVRKFWVISAGFFSMSLLTYEVALPLMLWSLLANLDLNIVKSAANRKRNIWFHIAPTVIAVFIAVLWQKVGAPVMLGSNFSRLAGFSLYSFGTWSYALLVSFPMQLYLTLLRHIVLSLAMAAFVFVLAIRSWDYCQPDVDHRASQKYRIWASSLALSSCSLLFVGSGAAADLTGYLNRGLTSTWLLLVLFISTLYESQFRSRGTAAALASLLVVLNFLWFFDKVQENNTVSALRSKVVAEISLAASQLPRNSTFLVDVPCLLPKSLSDVDFFCTAWDLKGALSVNSVNAKNVYPIWDWGFSKEANALFKQGEPVYEFVFNDSGELQSLQKINALSDLGNPYKRHSGGKSFFARECISIFLKGGSPGSNATLKDCLANPY